MKFGKIVLTKVACALILGIVTNVLCSLKKDKEAAKEETPASAAVETVAVVEEEKAEETAPAKEETNE